MAGVPWDLIESGALEPIADPREYAAVRSTLDPYAALGLSPGASAAEVQAAYRALALEQIHTKISQGCLGNHENS